MSLNATPRGDRVHIALFGRRNAGKSSIINSITNQDIALVSSVKGTTTDPVYKAMELLPIGPIVIIDTAGLDDSGELGQLRKKKTYEVLNKTDIAILVIDATVGVTEFDKNILTEINHKNLPVIGVLNKVDVDLHIDVSKLEEELGIKLIPVSTISKTGIEEVKLELIKKTPDDMGKYKLVGDLINPGDFVVLVTPIDTAAPKGRMILPQQQVIRDVIDADAIAIVTKETELTETLKNIGKKPAMVITDSQVFSKVSKETPNDILLTSFSILFARYKGDLLSMVKGAKALDKLKDGDKILISEGCTHHRQTDDIGTVKIPRWMSECTGKNLIFEWSSGMKYPDNLNEYSLVVHCGGCMLNKKEMMYRINESKLKEIPIVNYGVLIAYMKGILKRAVKPFPEVEMLLEDKKNNN